MAEKAPDLSLDITQDEQVPIHFAGGFGYDHGSRNAAAAEYIHSLGHKVIPPTYNLGKLHSREGFTAHLSDGSTTEVSKYSAYRLAGDTAVAALVSKAQVEKAKNLITHIEEHAPDRQVDGIYQSADAQNGLLAAAERPELFRNLILAYPAGLISKRSKAEHSLRMFRAIGKNRGYSHKPTPDNDFEPELRRETLLQRFRKGRFAKSGGFGTARSVALAMQNSILGQLRRSAKAPGISLVLGVRDAMMDPIRIIESLTSPDDIDFLFITGGKHGINGNKKIMKEMLDLIEKMEALKAKRRKGADVESLEKRVIFSDDVTERDKAKINNAVRELMRR